MADLLSSTTDYDMEDDPSLQLMSDLTSTTPPSISEIQQSSPAHSSHNHDTEVHFIRPTGLINDNNGTTIDLGDGFRTIEDLRTGHEELQEDLNEVVENVIDAMDSDNEDAAAPYAEQDGDFVYSQMEEDNEHAASMQREEDVEVTVSSDDEDADLPDNEEDDEETDLMNIDEDDTSDDLHSIAHAAHDSNSNEAESPDTSEPSEDQTTHEISAPSGSDEDGQDHDSDDENYEEAENFINMDIRRFDQSRRRQVIRSAISKQDKALHNLAYKLQPHTLPAHRYWIAVLVHKKTPKEAKSEKDFIWLKGSRVNTVQTIWNKYRDVTTEENFFIECCGENCDFDETMAELDEFKDKLIVFNASVRNREVINID